MKKNKLPNVRSSSIKDKQKLEEKKNDKKESPFKTHSLTEFMAIEEQIMNQRKSKIERAYETTLESLAQSCEFHSEDDEQSD